MKYHHYLLLPLPLLIFACSPSEEESKGRKQLKERVSENDDTLDTRVKYYLENTRVNFDNPIMVASSPNVACPVGLEQIYVEKDMPESSYFNIAILDGGFKFKKYLFNNSVVIKQVFTIEQPIQVGTNYYDSEETVRDTTTEFNSLLFFDLWEFEEREEDYRRLFVYDLNKDSLRQLSLPETSVLDWDVIKGKSLVYIKYLSDSNKDGSFDDGDDANIMFVNLNKNQPGEPIFEPEKLRKLKIEVALNNK